MSKIFDERLMPDEIAKNNIIYNEHLIRYQIAGEFAREKTVLDIACGTGYGAKILAQRGAEKVFALDIDKEAIQKANENFGEKNIEYIVGDCLDTHFADKKFDLVVSFETIEHLKNQEKFLDELKRILKEDGIVILSTPNKKVFKERNPYHTREFEKQDFEDILKKYFKHCYIAEQKNALASLVKLSDGKDSKVYLDNNKGEAQYYIAFCANRDIRNELPKINYISINSSALENFYNNPGLKIANKIYSLLIKIPGAKKLFKK